MALLLKRNVHRRTVLNGLLGGALVTVGVPLLDCLLNDNGTALASGAPLPLRFGTWFWGLGFQPGFGISGPQMTLGKEALPLERHKKGMNYFEGFNAQLDGRANINHWSGAVVCRTGTPPTSFGDFPAPTLDVLVSDKFNDRTRFRRLDFSASGPSRGYSARSTASQNTPEGSPVSAYTRMFGADFIDPNTEDFRPDPATMVTKSVLSAVRDQSKGLMQTLGARDKMRLDSYFTSVREIEQQLELQMHKPPPNAACKRPEAPPSLESAGGGQSFDMDVSAVSARHRVLADLLALALACNQARVFTMTYSTANSGLRKQGSVDTHHTMSHEEPIDAKVGYQPTVSWFNIQSCEQMAAFVDAFARIPEGDGTLLDNTIILAHSDTNDARTHQLNAVPMLTFGNGGRRIKTGMVIQGNGDPSTRVGLTIMQALGLPFETWGSKTNETSRAIREIMV
jgi:hypothetical protein